MSLNHQKVLVEMGMMVVAARRMCCEDHHVPFANRFRRNPGQYSTSTVSERFQVARRKERRETTSAGLRRPVVVKGLGVHPCLLLLHESQGPIRSRTVGPHIGDCDWVLACVDRLLQALT